jgi:hypothetical protein
VPAAAILPSHLTADERPVQSGVALLQAFVVALMVFPSDTVLKPIGAAGYPASLIGAFMLGLYVVSVLLGFHPLRCQHPIRGLLAVVWVSVLASYILMDRGKLTALELRGADGVLITYAVVTGVALVAAEWLRSLEDVMRVVRVLCWAGSFCAFVAVLQYWIGLDLSQYLRRIPGFVVNHDNPAIQARGSLNRVAGTAITPIELGVVMGMLMPVAICLGLYDREKTPFKRWGPLAIIVLGVATSVSRSAVLAVAVAFAVLLVLLPPVPRLGVLSAGPVALGAIFMLAHGLIGTLTSFFTGASSDTSVLYRTHDYPVAEAIWRTAPWFGHGPGSWRPTDSLNIFDNQYLGSAVELGAIGVIALLLYLVVPAAAALAARRSSGNSDLRLLCGALAAAGLATPVCSATFDSMAFPMFVNVYALIIGLVGACYRLAAAERQHARSIKPTVTLAPTRFAFQPPGALRPWRAET